ncbi:hypothetical protein I6A84_06415 [Frankia sp. CNm7]|uniref:Uncharacterized protein n=1 Tax=Frankia nepalensis TaxID=1836974 RepID=A0A937R9N9_9ACTN|nr:hypothetical protein [Frankia nepalensis]MBL7499683.1 hypothetical protein [Frankia nepalensis]MBL7515330.1 hypothetical protein [Frankia nepalensis]MBL7517768.1 hypothetical protein [Frankia nepalensis]MBL7626450.1 hypothetical protein [Frankia nepalensis]
MICPHCAESLLYRERGKGSRTCSKCRRKFALEPKSNPLRLHDLRLGRVAGALSAGGTLSYTQTQLWYAVSRRYLRGKDNRVPVGCLVAPTSFAAIALLLYVMVNVPSLPPLLVAIPAFGVIMVLVFVPIRLPTLKPPMSERSFRSALKEWQKIYGRPPVGLLPLDGALPPGAAPAAAPTAALLCADRDAVTCLRANGVERRLGLWIVTDPAALAAVPPALPVFVLRDASIPGERLLAAARAWPGRRVVDLGVTVPAARKAPSAMRLRSVGKVDRNALAELRAAPGALTEVDLRWIGTGWWSPLAALPPGRLIALLADGVDRLAADGDQDRAAARAVGFLSWPAA